MKLILIGSLSKNIPTLKILSLKCGSLTISLNLTQKTTSIATMNHMNTHLKNHGLINDGREALMDT